MPSNTGDDFLRANGKKVQIPKDGKGSLKQPKHTQWMFVFPGCSASGWALVPVMEAEGIRASFPWYLARLQSWTQAVRCYNPLL